MTQPTVILASASIGRKHLLEKLGVQFTVMPSSIDEDAIVDQNLYKMLEARAQAKAEDVAKKLTAISHQPSDNKSKISKLLSFKTSKLSSQYLIIAADSMAILDGQVFGKSQDKADSKRIVTALNGRTHEFVTATHVIHLTGANPLPFNVIPTPSSVIPSEVEGSLQSSQILGDIKLKPKLDSRLRGNDNFRITNSWHDLNISHVTTRKMSSSEIDSYVNRYDFTRFAAAYTLNETPWDWITKVEGSYTGVIGLPFEVVLPIFKKFGFTV